MRSRMTAKWCCSLSVADRRSAAGRSLKSIDLYPIYVRPTDGGPATFLGTGYGHALSDDGRWALTSTREGGDSKFILYPLGPGSSRTLEGGGLDMSASDERHDDSPRLLGRIGLSSMPDVATGRWQTYVQSIDGGPPTRVEHEPGQVVSPVAPDGNRFVSRRPDGSLWMATLAPTAGNPASVHPCSRISSSGNGATDGQHVVCLIA